MFENNRRRPAAALAGGLALVAWVGCGGPPSVASRSAAAFEEARKKGETFEDAGHSHGHGAMTPGGASPEESAADHDHGQHDHGQAEAAHDHAAMEQGGEEHGARDSHAGHAPRAGQTGHSGHAGRQDPHAGHDMSPRTPPASGHEDHSMDHGEMDHGQMDHGAQGEMAPDMAAAPVAVPPGQPAKTLNPDPLDAPAATSVQDAQRSAEMSEEMSGGGGHGDHSGHGGHGSHGAGGYKQTDAGREPAAHEEHQHGGAEEAAGYTCPMHPEVTSATPGKCPKCGMDLVKRRKG
ncbi:MAG TPA: heavy metal-binding domain-containing protein [Thermoanaerobaculia bacterium]